MARSSVAVVLIVVVGFVRGITVDERLNELEHIILLQAETLSKHEGLIREQRDKLETVQNENYILKNRVEILENAIELDTIRVEDVAHKSNTPATEDDQQLLSGDVHKRRVASVRSSENEFNLQESPQRRQLPSSKNVAFHAYMQTPICLHDHEVLVFNVEGIDVGNGYNKGDGIYVVPVTGTYVFTWRTYARSDWFISDIMVNGQTKGSVDADSSEDIEVAQATGLIIIHVVAGDHVYIMRNRGINCNIRDYQPWATFSGWLLF